MRRSHLSLLALVLALGACSGSTPSPQGASGASVRSASDPRVRSFMGAQLPGGGGGQWLRPTAGGTPKVIYYQFAFPG